MKIPLELEEYAIAIRRIIFEISSKVEMQQYSPQKVDKPHPFILFRFAKSLIKFQNKLD